MNDDIRYLHLCSRLMAKNKIDEADVDLTAFDNILYADFGMSSEEILENLRLKGRLLHVNNYK